MSRTDTRRSTPSPTQDEVLQFIEAYKADSRNDGNSPTYREIAHGLGKSTQTIYGACLRLAAKGLIVINARGKIVLQGGKYLRPDGES
ncbi:MAG: hypothetical protein KF716_12725 [Anaerolineae bacterium]|nr:hypothetical protein [Anaerolineae bacterium]